VSVSAAHRHLRIVAVARSAPSSCARDAVVSSVARTRASPPGCTSWSETTAAVQPHELFTLEIAQRRVARVLQLEHVRDGSPLLDGAEVGDGLLDPEARVGGREARRERDREGQDCDVRPPRGVIRTRHSVL
jgi:hypothetical protein